MSAAVGLGRAVTALVAVLVVAACGSSATVAAAPAPLLVRAPDLQPGMVPAAPQGKALLTLTGRIGTTNAAGATLALDRTALDRFGLLATSVNDPWAKKRVALQGFWLRDLIAMAHPDASASTLHIRALDDYQVDLKLADVRTAGIFLATRDGQGAPLPAEDGGPTRVVFTDDLASRFSPDLWIWNIDTIEVR